MTKQTPIYLSNKILYSFRFPLRMSLIVSEVSSLSSREQTDDWAESNLIICLCPSHLMSVLSIFVFS